MAAREFVKVVIADRITGQASVVNVDVGSDLSGLSAVSIVGGNYRQSDPWVVELKRIISLGRQF